MSTKPSKATRPPTDGTLTPEQYKQALTASGLAPAPRWAGQYGVSVRGPYHRTTTDDGGMVVRVRSYYRITFEDPPGSGRRGFKEERTLALAKATAARIDKDLGAGLSSKEAPKRFETIDDLIDAYLEPANHLDRWHSPRSVQAPKTFLDVWVRPVIGHLACVDWDSRGSQRILEQMAKCGLKVSYRSQGYTYLTALATFGRKRTYGFLPHHADPLEDVNRPNAKEVRYVEPQTLPSPELIAAFAANLGDVAANMWLRKVKNPSPARRERAEFERFRWSMLPRIVCGGGPRPNEALAMRTGDFLLDDRDEGLGLHIERQADRGSSTGTRLPKHGLKRTTYMSDELWDDVVKLVRWTEALFGSDVLVWPRMRDHTKMLDDSTLHRAYFIPAAEATPGFTSETVLQWTVVEEPVTDSAGRVTMELVTVPLRDATGRQKTKRVWNYNWRHFRHLYGTNALAPKDTGGQGQDIGDVSAWMGHRSSQTTWDYYIGQRDQGGRRMAAATRKGPAVTSDSPAPPPQPGAPAATEPRSRAHLRVVS